MTIKQKLIVFASSMVLVAMVIATLVSNVVFNNMLTNSAGALFGNGVLFCAGTPESASGTDACGHFLGRRDGGECRRPWRGGILLRWKNSSGE